MDDKLFEQYYEEYRRDVYAICRSCLGDEQEAHDATQDIFIHKWYVRDSYDPARASFKTWLRRNAYNKCWDILRRRRRIADVDQTFYNSPAPMPVSQRVIQGLDISDCLNKLDALDRQILLMKHLEGYTWEEVAQLTALTVPKVRAREAKARAGFLNCLAEEETQDSAEASQI